MKSLAALLLLGGCTIIVPCAEKAETPRASEYYGGCQCLRIEPQGDSRAIEPIYHFNGVLKCGDGDGDLCGVDPMPLMPQCLNGCLTPNGYDILPAGKGAYRLEPKLEFTE